MWHKLGGCSSHQHKLALMRAQMCASAHKKETHAHKPHQNCVHCTVKVVIRHAQIFVLREHTCARTHARTHTHTHLLCRAALSALPPGPHAAMSHTHTHAHTHTHTHTTYTHTHTTYTCFVELCFQPFFQTPTQRCHTHAHAHTHTHTTHLLC